jgi:predicted ATPase
MISQLDLRFFKCFEVLKLPLAPLTLLSGTNASGKSTVLQSLVLLNQTMKEHEWSTRLMLNGKTIRLGTVYDVVDTINGRNRFEIGVHDEKNYYLWNFTGERKEMSLSIDTIFINEKRTSFELLRFLFPYRPGEASPELANKLKDLTYITAERVGPREIYSLDDLQISSVVGPAGENTINVLHWKRDNPVNEILVSTKVANTCLKQVEEKMREFFPGLSLEIQQVPHTNSVTLGLRTSSDTPHHRPIHEGFGLTQILPVVVAGMTTSKGNILLIENPEVHLHPAGQAQMGQFLSKIASAGVQVILETHSDHILNGIRRSVKSEILKPSEVAIHFFRNRSQGNQVLSPLIDNNGNIDVWPEGFFDQFDLDMDYFADWSD